MLVEQAKAHLHHGQTVEAVQVGEGWVQSAKVQKVTVMSAKVQRRVGQSGGSGHVGVVGGQSHAEGGRFGGGHETGRIGG